MRDMQSAQRPSLCPAPLHHPSLVDRLVERVFAAVVEERLKPGAKVTEETHHEHAG